MRPPNNSPVHVSCRSVEIVPGTAEVVPGAVNVGLVHRLLPAERRVVAVLGRGLVQVLPCLAVVSTRRRGGEEWGY